ncbi:MAG TPA: hypothetical protein VH500_22700 [Nitrososphaeraceae archaeon]
MTNLDPIDKLFTLSTTKHNEIYVIPPIPRTPPWVNSGLHMSFHASGQSHVKMNLPISCLNQRIEHKLSFNRSGLIEDIIAKRDSFFREIDVNNDEAVGTTMVLKTEPMLRNFFNTPYVRNYLENPRYIDYYNSVLTHPYFPPSHFRRLFPYKEFEIDGLSIKRAFRTYENDSLSNLTKRIEISNTDLIFQLLPEGFLNVALGKKGIRLDLNNPRDLIAQLPGGRVIHDLFKDLV